ncbi:hypothetical protein KIH41_14915 [Litoribacter ruber]|uniref:Uncharacterized protein n=1 Tax=Litoribacter ruber TaxID=702568 RepID=A0AAP2G4T7_9BACT|nr:MULTISPECIES: hypothetical protein [Litoribacter]MBS9524840.1 hypothetical protein [Litoribacter alkaliphilus]MBT0812577.1 hypothetical protein [Litoribacter ruber]
MEYLYIILIILVIAGVLIFPIWLFLRRSTELKIQGSEVTFISPIQSESISFEKDLISWQVQEAYFLWWGKVYAINMQFAGNKWKSINSRIQPENYQKLLRVLSEYYAEKRIDKRAKGPTSDQR